MTKPAILSQKVMSNITNLREEDKFTDLKITHSLGDFSVHRVIVCSQSKVLYKACDNGFKEHFEGVIDMGHVSYNLLERMISFFYNMDYDGELSEGASGTPLQLHAQMFALADQYDIADLLTRAKAKYAERCAKALNPIDLLSSVPDVFGSTPASLKDLRQIACLEVRKHLPGMLEDPLIAECFEKTLSENPAFTNDLLGSYIKKRLIGYCQNCRSDQGMEPLQTRCQSCDKGQASLGPQTF